jgi:hypothetical protein
MPKKIRGPEDAKELLRHGKDLTKKQKGLFGAIAGGSKRALQRVKARRAKR